MSSRDSCLQLDARHSKGTSGNVFEGLLARGEPSSALFETSKILALRNREKEWDENHKILQYPLLVLIWTLRPGTLYTVLEELVLKILGWKIRGIRCRSCISVNSQTQVTSSVGYGSLRISHDRNVMDQRSGGGQVSGRSSSTTTQVRLLHRSRRTHRVPLRVQKVYEVTILIIKRRETDAMIPKPKTKSKWGQETSNGRPLAGPPGVVGGVHR